MSGMVTLFQSAVEGSIASLLTGKTASVKQQACWGRLEARRVLEKVKFVAIQIITELCGLKEHLRKLEKIKYMGVKILHIKIKVIFLPKDVDRLKLYAIYSYRSTLDGLIMIFKIVNNNRREMIMFRTICIL